MFISIPRLKRFPTLIQCRNISCLNTSLPNGGPRIETLNGKVDIDLLSLEGIRDDELQSILYGSDLDSGQVYSKMTSLWGTKLAQDFDLDLDLISIHRVTPYMP